MYNFNNDYYGILHIDMSATPAEIKKAYLKYVKIYHPDCGGDAKLFNVLHEAYEVLSDANLRESYDWWYRENIMQTNQNNTVHKVYMRVFNPENLSQNTVIVMVDFLKFPPEKFADDENVFYGIAAQNTTYICTKSEWMEFVDKQVQKFEKQRRKSESIKFYLKFAVIAALIIAGGIFLRDYNGLNIKTGSNYTNDYEDISGLVEYAKPAQGTCGFRYDESPQYWQHYSSLEIKLSENDNNYYYIKVIDSETDEVVQTVFLHPGTTFEVTVPAGKLYLKYACGTKWYGSKYYFGSQGSYAKADEILDFTPESGYTVTLYPVTNGNYETESISMSDF